METNFLLTINEHQYLMIGTHLYRRRYAGKFQPLHPIFYKQWIIPYTVEILPPELLAEFVEAKLMGKVDPEPEHWQSNVGIRNIQDDLNYQLQP